MSEWEDLRGFDDWARKLDELLEEARQALDDQASPVGIQRRLRAFRMESPLGPRFERLNRIAAKAVSDIAAQTFAQAAEGIAARSNELDDAVREIEGMAHEIRRVAGRISLESPRAIVSSLTNTIESLTELSEASDGDVLEKIEKAVDSIRALRESIETA